MLNNICDYLSNTYSGLVGFHGGENKDCGRLGL
jgi:hypothetical protein